MSEYVNPLDISETNIGRPVHLIRRSNMPYQKSTITGFLNAVSEVVSVDGERIRSLHIGNGTFTVAEGDEIRFINLPKQEQ